MRLKDILRKTAQNILFIRDRSVGRYGCAAKALGVSKHYRSGKSLIGKIEVCCNDYNLGSLRTFIKGKDTVRCTFSPYFVVNGKQKDSFYLSILSSESGRA